MKLKSNRGITLAALSITVVLFLIILTAITFSSLSSVRLKQLNNMYSDIINLQEKIDLYYLENGVLPTNGTTISKNSKDCVKDGNINPNDDDTYYLVDITQLDNITLNNSKATDLYYVNNQSHTVYYEKGAQVGEDENVKQYTIDLADYVDITDKLQAAQN